MEAMAEEECASLSHRAEVFRSKLLENFQIIESVSEKGRIRAAVYSSSDVTNPAIMERILKENPDQMIKFKVYKREYMPQVATIDRRLTRIKNKNKLPIPVWANLVVESNTFQKFLMLLIIVNSISIGIQGELPVSDHPGLIVLHEFLDFIDAFTVIVFSVEIVLKWVDNFSGFWSNYWNVFDLIVTVLSAIPHLVLLFAGSETELAAVAEHLGVFRILRTLKMVSRFGGLRIIVLTILQAFQSMVFITVLLCIMAYIFAVVGVTLFASYSSSERNDLTYSQSFSSLPNAMITLFQLFTLDQWYKIYNDLTKVSNVAITLTYILLWVWIGSFLFRNLFVGIMVNNFQSITAELVRQRENMENSEELARMKEELNMELTRHDARMQKARKSVAPSTPGSMHSDEEMFGVGRDLSEQISQLMMEEEEISDGWDKTVHAHLVALASNPIETLWPRDTLFKYLQLLEQLQENLEEYDKLQKLATACLLELHDS